MQEVSKTKQNDLREPRMHGLILYRPAGVPVKRNGTQFVSLAVNNLD